MDSPPNAPGFARAPRLPGGVSTDPGGVGSDAVVAPKALAGALGHALHAHGQPAGKHLLRQLLDAEHLEPICVLLLLLLFPSTKINIFVELLLIVNK